ncbi:MAG: WbqC family protein [Emcibacter sp.]|nr:WbqC family protein [Emcibacter sp.]
MILSGHQPVYLPSIHLFNKIALSDKFMFVGHCQFVNKNWHSRNYIRNGKESQILTVPVLKTGRFGQSISETVINGDHWKRKHLGSIKNAYQKRPYFKDYFPAIEELINRPWIYLGDLNIALVVQFLEWLKIDVPIFYSENHKISGHKTDMLISMCQAMGADHYLSNEGARSYVEEARMSEVGICHLWQDFSHPEYGQGADFIPNLSIIDCLFNMGPASRDIVIKAGTISA